MSYNIPDPDGLLRMVVMARILHSRKLFGPDIKFLRKAVGVKQKDLAPKIEMSPEHLSRCETGDLPIGPGSEKLLRLFLFKTVIKHHKFKECEAKTKLEEALDKLFDIITPVAAHGIEDELVFYFSRRTKSPSDAGNDNPGEDDDGWKDGVLSAVA
jgi:DNA-binding transcriptional regulator YiaG